MHPRRIPISQNTQNNPQQVEENYDEEQEQDQESDDNEDEQQEYQEEVEEEADEEEPIRLKTKHIMKAKKPKTKQQPLKKKKTIIKKKNEKPKEEVLFIQKKDEIKNPPQSPSKEATKETENNLKKLVKGNNNNDDSSKPNAVNLNTSSNNKVDNKNTQKATPKIENEKVEPAKQIKTNEAEYKKAEAPEQVEAFDFNKVLEIAKIKDLPNKARFIQKPKSQQRNLPNNSNSLNSMFQNNIQDDDEETNQTTFMGSRIKNPPIFSSFLSTKDEVNSLSSNNNNDIAFNKNLFDTLIKKSESFNLETQRRGR